MKKLLLGGIVAALVIGALAVSKAHAEDSDTLSLCVKNSGVVFVVGEGFKTADCNNNDKLITLNLSGTVGPPGADGKSAYEIAQSDGGYTGTVIEWMASLVGPQGPQGIQGEKGDKGDKGDQGEQGLVGPQGSQGEAGLQGVQGEKGDTGAQGLQGDTGIQGPQGEKGDKGDTGEQGLQGLTGSQGEKGDKGDQGPIGLTGLQGEKGDDGVSGWEIVMGTPSAPSEQFISVTATCPGNKRVIGGGYRVLNASHAAQEHVAINSSYPSSEHVWTVTSEIDGTDADMNYSLQAYAICTTVNP